MGKVEESYVENKSKDNKFKVPCTQCNGKTSHKVIQSYDYTGREWLEKDSSVDWSDNYQIIGSSD